MGKIMTYLQFLLAKLSEECHELGLEAGKSIQFGLDSFNPELVDSQTNLQNLKKEFNDVLAVVEMINSYLYTKEDREVTDLIHADENMIKLKKMKLIKFKRIAEENGTLTILKK
jgi:NTP pyrophosphatase (non-canonical NTP hydrolase)